MRISIAIAAGVLAAACASASAQTSGQGQQQTGPVGQSTNVNVRISDPVLAQRLQQVEQEQGQSAGKSGSSEDGIDVRPTSTCWSGACGAAPKGGTILR